MRIIKSSNLHFSKNTTGRVVTDKEVIEITLIDILGSEADDVIKEVNLKIEKNKIYRNLDILDDLEKVAVGAALD